jgi:NADPH-dependent glutamate synthase beta subunit-like oxidoreductase/coenzyme F420-reducing hydrogenase delta subunit/Pyruvate/2-oxoacid:ferredoxin oxidoreductase delta subunit
VEKKEPKITVSVPRGGEVWELVPLETSPCTLACPTRINARGYVSLIADGRFSEALALIRERNPFPGVCGRVCPRPCEAACTRRRYDDPIAICALKRFVFDLEMKRGIDAVEPARIHRTDKVAVIGAGPAGLSAARELALFGYPVTIFEARSAPGGMLNLIPEFRLPRSVVRRESQAILDLGIELVANTEFGRAVTWNQLRRRGYRALLLATGAWKPKWTWGRKGVRGVRHALEFLEHAGLEVEDARVIVAGDGAMGLDCARTAVRLGAKRTTLLIGTSRDLAPVSGEELAQAENEGVRIVFLARLSGLVTKRGRLEGVVCSRLRELEPDATGRREVVEISGSRFEGNADLFVDASDRGVEAGRSLERFVTMSPGGTVAVDPATSGVAARGVFAAGDLVAGPRSVVEAIASGQKAAYGIHAYLSGERLETPFDLTVDDEIARREFSLDVVPERTVPRIPMPLEEARARRADFREVERGYSAQTARREAQRCLRCGPCSECDVCVDICEKKNFVLRVSDDLAVDVHAGRRFWSRAPERIVLEAGEARVEASPIRTICVVNEATCVGCGRCSEVCVYKAVQVESRPGGRFIARVDELACKGCGVCVPICPTGAIDQMNFERDEILRRLSSIVPSKTKVLFLCHWARPETLDLPRDVLVIEMMCSGATTARYIVEAVLRGSPKVVLCGCEEDDCRYAFGRGRGAVVLDQARRFLALLGYDPDTVADISSAPADFAAVRALCGDSR